MAARHRRGPAENGGSRNMSTELGVGRILLDKGEVESSDHWRDIFEFLYEGAQEVTTGWTSSLTGMPFTEDAMCDWADASAKRIVGLDPTKILEIGAGTGMIMRRVLELAPGLHEYTATDFAAASEPFLQRVAADFPAITTSIQVGPDRTGSIDHDTIVLNSVAQYFPHKWYFEDLLQTCASQVPESGGHIYLGDLRDSTLLDQFYAAIERSGTTDPAAVDFELSFSPAYIAGLASLVSGVRAVEMAPRADRFETDMSIYRFDATLHVKCACPLGSRISRADQLSEAWDRVQGLDESEQVVLAALPNRRLSPDALGAIEPNQLAGMSDDDLEATVGLTDTLRTLELRLSRRHGPVRRMGSPICGAAYLRDELPTSPGDAARFLTQHEVNSNTTERNGRASVPRLVMRRGEDHV